MGTITCECSCGWSGQMPEDSDAWTCPKCSLQHAAEWRDLYFVATCPKTREPVGLSEKNAQNPRFTCLRCGRRHPTMPNFSVFGQVILSNASYAGGHSALGPAQRGRLILMPDAVGLGSPGGLRATSAVIPLASVRSIEVSGGQVAQSKVEKVLAFGVLGGLLAGDSRYESAIVVRTKDDETAYYTVDDESSTNVRAKMTPILRAAGVPLLGDEAAATPAAPSAPISVADELAKLASLRNDGLLTDEEFEAQKARLLAAGG